MNWEIEKNNYQNEEEDISISQKSSGNEPESDVYASIGLSIQSQEKICEFHELLGNESPEQTKLFEEILCSVLQDIQNYKNEVDRLENVYKNEKDQNQLTIKSMIDEAERQLNTMMEKIKFEEKNRYLKIIENLKQEYCQEIASLQESLINTRETEIKLRQCKIVENTQLKQLKLEVENLNLENRDLKTQLRKSQSEISVLRSEIAELTNICNEKNCENYVSNDVIAELCKLKQEISALHNANQKLNDSNDVLKSLIQKQKEINNERRNLSPSLQKEKVVSQNECLNAKHNSTLSSFYDEEIDSGYVALNNELSDFYNDTFFPNSLSSNFNFECQSTPVSENADQQKFVENLNLNENKTSTLRKLSNKKENKNEIIQSNEIESNNIFSNSNPERVFKLVFAGDSGVGKTSFITRYCKGQFNPSTSATIGIDHYMKVLDIDGKRIALQLWDTCGQERFRSIAKSYFRRADGVVLMYDCTCEKSFLNVREWIEIINDTSDKRIPIVIIGNKIDLREDEIGKNSPLIPKEQGFKLAKQFNSLFIETSAKDGSNIDESLIEICRTMSTNQDIELKSDRIRLGMSSSVKKKTCC